MRVLGELLGSASQLPSVKASGTCAVEQSSMILVCTIMRR